MVSPTISHLIGTTTLIMIFFTASFFYGNIYSSMQTEVLKIQLQEAANYVSSNLVDLFSLCTLSSTDQLLIKSLDMPANIGDSFFNVTIIKNINPETLETSLVVRAILTAGYSATGGWAQYNEAPLPWTTIKIWNGTQIYDLGKLKLRLSISSSEPNLVVWALKKGDEITIGLGVMTTS